MRIAKGYDVGISRTWPHEITRCIQCLLTVWRQWRLSGFVSIRYIPFEIKMLARNNQLLGEFVGILYLFVVVMHLVWRLLYLRISFRGLGKISNAIHSLKINLAITITVRASGNQVRLKGWLAVHLNIWNCVYAILCTQLRIFKNNHQRKTAKI